MRRSRFWLTWSWRDLRRRWLVVAAIAGVIAIGTGLATGLGSMETWRLRSNDASFAALDAHDLRVSLAEGSYARAGQLVAALRRIPAAAGIAAADERLMIRTQVDARTRGHDVFVPATLYGVSVAAGRHVDGVAALAGRALQARDAGRRVALLNAMFARANRLSNTGWIVLSGGHRLRYVGLGTSPQQFVITAPTGLYSGAGGYGVVYTSIETAGALSGRPGAVNELVLTLRPGVAPRAIERQIERVFVADHELARLGATITRKVDENAYRILYEDARNDQQVFDAFTLLVLAAAAFAALNLIHRVVESERREIGVGMSLGVPGRTLAIRPLLLAAQIALLGALLGVGAGIVIGDAMAGVLRAQTALPEMRTGLQLGIFARGAALGFAVPLLAALVPVWRGTRLTPVEAIRTGPRTARGAGLTALLRHLPLPGGTIVQLPIRNLLRTPRRTLTTLLAVASVITIVIAFAGMIDSFSATVDKSRADLLSRAPNRVYVTLDRFYATADPRVQALLAAHVGARSAASLSLPGELVKGSTSIDAMLSVLRFDNRLWRPQPLSGRVPERSNEILLARKAAHDLGVGIGDTIVLRHPQRSGATSFRLVDRRVVVTGLHANPLRVLAYLDYGSAARSFGLQGATNVVGIEPGPGSSSAAVQRALFGQAGVASLQPVSAAIDEVDRSVEQFRGIIRVAELSALLLTLLIAFNAISINLEERRRDFATMFAYGLPVRTALRSGMVENALVGALGTLLGIGLGVAVLSWIVTSLFPETFPDLGVVRSVASESLLIAVFVGVVVMGAAPLLVLRRLLRMDIPSTLRVVE